MTVHEAKIEDIEQLALHHRKMFEEIWEKKGSKLATDKAQNIQQAYKEKLTKQIPESTCKAWIIKKDNQLIASGAISILCYVPVPDDTNLNIAYLHSMYTERKFRGNKLAQRIIDTAIQYCKGNGIHRIVLNSSDDGKPIYEKVGFASVPDSMRLLLNRGKST